MWVLSFTTKYVAALKHCKACAGVTNHSRTNVGVRIDPRTCLTLLFLGPVSKVKMGTQGVNLCYLPYLWVMLWLELRRGQGDGTPPLRGSLSLRLGSLELQHKLVKILAAQLRELIPHIRLNAVLWSACNVQCIWICLACNIAKTICWSWLFLFAFLSYHF